MGKRRSSSNCWRAKAIQDQEHEKAFILRSAINCCKDLLKSAWRRRTGPMEEAGERAAPELEETKLLAKRLEVAT